MAKAGKPRRYSTSKGISGEGISGELQDFAMTSSASMRPNTAVPGLYGPKDSSQRRQDHSSEALWRKP
uniref:Uncharacterized protein n=1 Tax=Oryza punctata TaxID=4537 RepID=A0A0E0JZA2_ORYPU